MSIIETIQDMIKLEHDVGRYPSVILLGRNLYNQLTALMDEVKHHDYEKYLHDCWAQDKANGATDLEWRQYKDKNEIGYKSVQFNGMPVIMVLHNPDFIGMGA